MEILSFLHQDRGDDVPSDHDEAGPSVPIPRAVDHAGWMGVALALARSMRGRVWPNPPVGCVIVRDDDIVGTGFTQVGGRPHAERVALDQAGTRARGANLYVTLEPCCHWGKTPPCSEAIIAAGVKAVYAAIQDPDPRVDGGGFARLREAGIHVDIGIGAREARAIMAGFFHRIATGRPLVEIVPGPVVGDTIPEGFDALLRSGDGVEMTLLVRAPTGLVIRESIAYGVSAKEVLDELGHRGLTSVTLSADDPRASTFAPGSVSDPSQDETYL